MNGKIWQEDAPNPKESLTLLREDAKLRVRSMPAQDF